MTIKVLPLDRWMRPTLHLPQRLEDTLYHYVQTAPVFGRPGRYWWKARPKALACWFEMEDGRAFLYSAESFEYDLRHLNASRFNSRQVEALSQVVAQKVATREQVRLWQACMGVVSQRKSSRSARRSYLDWRKRAAELLKGRNEPS